MKTETKQKKPPMTLAENAAYIWALMTNRTDDAAQYAKVLAEYILRNQK